jgi:hypothetical protein
VLSLDDASTAMKIIASNHRTAAPELGHQDDGVIASPRNDALRS